MQHHTHLNGQENTKVPGGNVSHTIGWFVSVIFCFTAACMRLPLLSSELINGLFIHLRQHISPCRKETITQVVKYTVLRLTVLQGKTVHPSIYPFFRTNPNQGLWWLDPIHAVLSQRWAHMPFRIKLTFPCYMRPK